MRKSLLLLLLLPTLAHAGVSYDLTSRGLFSSAGPPVTQRYFVEGGNIRMGAPDRKGVVILKDKTLYFIDNEARTIRVDTHGTLAEVNATRNSLIQPEASDYVATDRSESVGGHTCVIWQRVIHGMKRREICVAPVNEVPGGAELLAGLKTFSEYSIGTLFALGVNFGTSPWWSSIESLGGLPLLVREFSPIGALGETTLTGIRPAPLDAALFEIPHDYQTTNSTHVPGH